MFGEDGVEKEEKDLWERIVRRDVRNTAGSSDAFGPGLIPAIIYC